MHVSIVVFNIGGWNVSCPCLHLRVCVCVAYIFMECRATSRTDSGAYNKIVISQEIYRHFCGRKEWPEGSKGKPKHEEIYRTFIYLSLAAFSVKYLARHQWHNCRPFSQILFEFYELFVCGLCRRNRA